MPEAAIEKIGRFVVQNELSSFEYHLRSVGLSTARALEDDELLAELAARGVETKKLKELLETVEDIRQSFYNEPKPA